MIVKSEQREYWNKRRVCTNWSSVRSDVKRQRTASSAISSAHSEAGSSAIESDGDPEGGKVAKKARGAARKSLREKVAKEKEKERAEAATKRKGRVERRRADGKFYPSFFHYTECLFQTPGSDPPDETSAKNSSNGKASPTATEHHGSPLPPAPTVSKRGGRRAGAGRGRGGHAGHAHTPSEKESRTGNSPKDEHVGNGGETSTTILVANGNPPPAKRGRWRKEDPVNQDSDRDKSDGNNHNSDGRGDNGSNPTSAGTESNGNGINQSIKVDGKEASTKRDKDPSMNELKRRAHAMLDFLKNVQAETPDAPGLVVDSPPASTNVHVEGVVGSPLAVEAERLKGKLEKWQVEFA
jgi:hypothetical protein